LNSENPNKKSVRSEIDELFKEGLKKGVFSGGCISFSRPDKGARRRCHFSYGTTGAVADEKEVEKKTFFDLASLTKPLVTTLSAAVLIEEGILHLDDKISGLKGWQVAEDKKEIEIMHLLSHSSGLPAHRPYYEKLYAMDQVVKKRALKKWILAEKLCFSPGTDMLYSDLGFILLGFLIEEKTGETLDAFWEKKIASPLKLRKELFFPKRGSFNTRHCVATEKCLWSGQMLCGEVHDDNCRAMGGVAGHAGLFGTAPAVLALCEHLIEQVKGRKEHPSYSSDVLRILLKKAGGLDRPCGFDVPTEGISSSGRFFSSESRGHLGFTGTSFWIDFTRETAVVLLTNRVHMGNGMEGIREFRPLLHDLIMKAVVKG